MRKKDIYLEDMAEMINDFYKDAEAIGTTDAILNVMYKAYEAGKEVGIREGRRNNGK